MSFFEFLQQIYHKNLQGYTALNGGIDKFLYNGSKITQEIKGKLSFPTNSYAFVLQKGENNVFFSKEVLGYYNNDYDITNFSTETYLHNSAIPRERLHPFTKYPIFEQMLLSYIVMVEI